MTYKVIQIPLNLTRYWLYGIIFVVSTLVLLPISSLSYLYFYKVLIPEPTISLPLQVRNNDASYFQNMTADVDLTHTLSHFEQEPDIKYEVYLEYSSICQTGYNLVTPIQYFFEDGRAKSFDSVGQNAYRNQFFVACDVRDVYASQNWLVPFNLRFWLPPILSTNSKMVKVSHKLLDISGRSIIERFGHRDAPGRLALKYDSSSLFTTDVRLNFYIKWDGVRYYLFNYYFTSFAIGVALLWSTSSLVCIITSLIVWTKLTSTSEKPIRRSRQPFNAK